MIDSTDSRLGRSEAHPEETLIGTSQNGEASDARSTRLVDDERDVSNINLLEGSLAYAIKQAQVRCYEVLFGFYGPDALSPGRMTALCLIGVQPGIHQSALADLLRINRASVIKVVNSLQALGFIERQAIPRNKRSQALVVTEKGHAELQRLTALTRQYEEIVAAGLTPAERKTLFRLLAKTAANPAKLLSEHAKD